MKILNIKKLLLSLGIVLAILLPSTVFALDCTNPATSKEAIQCGVNDTTKNPGDGTAAANDLNTTAINVINVLSIIAGAAAVIMLIVGGFRFVTSGGNQEAAASARRTIMYAIIGLVVVAVSQLIVHFVLTETK